MFELKFDLKGVKLTARRLRALEKTLASLNTYAADVRTATVEGIEQQIASGKGWKAKKDGSKATLIDSGEGAREASRKGNFKLVKLGNRVVLKGKTKLAFHHYGTKNVPRRRIFKDTNAVRNRLQTLMEKRAQRIIKSRMRK